MSTSTAYDKVNTQRRPKQSTTRKRLLVCNLVEIVQHGNNHHGYLVTYGNVSGHTCKLKNRPTKKQTAHNNKEQTSTNIKTPRRPTYLASIFTQSLGRSQALPVGLCHVIWLVPHHIWWASSFFFERFVSLRLFILLANVFTCDFMRLFVLFCLASLFACFLAWCFSPGRFFLTVLVCWLCLVCWLFRWRRRHFTDLEMSGNSFTSTFVCCVLYVFSFLCVCLLFVDGCEIPPCLNSTRAERKSSIEAYW